MLDSKRIVPFTALVVFAFSGAVAYRNAVASPRGHGMP